MLRTHRECTGHISGLKRSCHGLAGVGRHCKAEVQAATQAAATDGNPRAQRQPFQAPILCPCPTIPHCNFPSAHPTLTRGRPHLGFTANPLAEGKKEFPRISIFPLCNVHFLYKIVKTPYKKVGKASPFTELPNRTLRLGTFLANHHLQQSCDGGVGQQSAAAGVRV